jgi:hypothetical protein
MENIVKTRLNMFEVNSSSSHSLSISLDNDGMYQYLHPNSDGVITTNTTDGFDGVLDTPDEKLSYAVTYAYCTNDYNLKKMMLDNIKSVIKTHTGAELEIDDLHEGYIEDMNQLSSVFLNPDLTKNFIFNPESTMTCEYN